MHTFWSCSNCVLPLFLALFGVMAEGADVKRWDGVHRIEKVMVTTVFSGLQRRDGPSCPTSHTMCPASLNGQCCPAGYECATESCFATTRGPQTCDGKPNYYGCAADLGGGCCPEGLICQLGGQCVPPDGSDVVQSCPANYSLCPKSFNYGCCPNGMGCAKNVCYSTEPSTYTFTRTLTTTDAAAATITTTLTQTTLVNPSPPSTLPGVVSPDDPTQAVLKYYPSYVPKVAPIQGKKDGGDGLTTAQIAGIVGGAIGFLIVVLVAAYIIIRHLNKVVQAVESSKGGGTSSGSKSRPQMHQFRPTPSEVDDMSVDPLMVPPRPSHRRQTSEPDVFGYGSPELDGSYRGTPSSSGGYHPVPNSTGDRHASFDSAGQPQGYFEVMPNHPARFSGQSSVPPGSRRVSGESQGTYAHVRHWSNASEASSDGGTPGARTPLGELDSTPYVPELPATPTTEFPGGQERRRSSGSGVSLMTRPSLSQQRRRSESNTRGRSDSAANANQLGVVTEDTEVIGHYGPSDRMAGQTAAGLNRVDSGGTTG